MANGDDDLHRYASRAARMGASEIRELLKLLDQPDVISFAGGIPNPDLFPADELAAAFGDAIGTGAAGALQYSVSEGYAPLREWIVRRMGELGVPCGLDNVVITSGSQQALDFVGKLTLSPGDTALVTAPTYLGALQAFNAYEPRYDTLQPESAGPSAPAYADAARAAGSRIGLAYVVSDFANPTGETLSLAAREHLLDLTGELDVLLVEDAAYTDLRFAGEPDPLLPRSHGPQRRHRAVERPLLRDVLEDGGARPAHRLGLRAVRRGAPDRAREAGIRPPQLVRQPDRDAPVIEEVYERQLERVQATYRERRDVMLGALERSMPGDVLWREPEGGMFVWLTLRCARRRSAPARARAGRAACRLRTRPGVPRRWRGHQTIRLSYSLPPHDAIEEGIARLGALLAAS